METIGFMSITGLSTGEAKAPSSHHINELVAATPRFSRRYIDNNPYSFHKHTSLNSTTFPTSHGRNVSAMIASARKALKLDHRFGCAPSNLWTNRAPFPSENSIFTWLQKQVFPSMISDTARKDIPRLVIVNTGGIRFDVFKGPFTIDTIYAISPFTSGFRYIKDVPYQTAKKLITVLNQEVPQIFDLPYDLAAKMPASGQWYQSVAEDSDVNAPFQDHQQVPLSLRSSDGKDKDNLTPGYITTDAAGSDGDDTIHSPIKFYNVPNIFETHIRFPSSSASTSASSSSSSSEAEHEPETVDLVYVDFIERYVLLALKFLGTDYGEGDTEVYMEGKSLTGVISEWVEGNWEGDC